MNRSAASLLLVVATFMIALAGCQGDGGTEPTEKILAIAATSPLELSGTVGTPVTPAPAVRVTDSDGQPVADVTVTFSATAGSGKAEPGAVATDANGQASAAWSLGAIAGLAKHTLTVRVGALPPVVFSATAVAGKPEFVSAASGATQIAAAGSAAPSALKAFVGDRFGNPVAGVPVSFSVIAGGGGIDPTSVITDSAGFATAGTWTLGPVEGVQTVRAIAADTSATFSADTYDCSHATEAAPCVGLGELVFNRPSDNQIYRINVDGHGLARLTVEGINRNPVWSPDGRRIAFIRATRAANSNLYTSDVYIMNADGSNTVRRTTRGYYQSVAWSPDGRKLAVAGYPGYDYSHIFIISAAEDDSPEFSLSTDGAAPSWSPDSDRIAYSRGTGYYDFSRIEVINTDGTRSRPLFEESTGSWNSYPAWSPDGRRISFMRCVSGCDAYIVNDDGSQLTPVPSTRNVGTTAWSPNGKWLAVSAWEVRLAWGVAYIPVEGGIPRPVVEDAQNPSWRPPLR